MGRPYIGGEVTVLLGVELKGCLDHMVAVGRVQPAWAGLERATLIRRLLDLGVAEAARRDWPGASDLPGAYLYEPREGER